MKSIIVRINVKPERIEEFKKITLYNAENAVKEPGCVRFDVIADSENPNLFFLYEVYKSPEAIDEHKKTAHYNKWVETVADLMEKPRERWLGEVL